MNAQDKDFAPLIWIAVERYNNSFDKHSKTKLKEALKDCLKKWSDQPVKMVSEKVYNMAKESGIDPFTLMWPKRNIFGKKDNKSILVWEHTTPLNEFYQTLIKCKTLQEIELELSNYSGVCWITRNEDNLLNKNKFKSNRPGGWEKCYSICEIKIIKK